MVFEERKVYSRLWWMCGSVCSATSGLTSESGSGFMGRRLWSGERVEQIGNFLERSRLMLYQPLRERNRVGRFLVRNPSSRKLLKQFLQQTCRVDLAFPISWNFSNPFAEVSKLFGRCFSILLSFCRLAPFPV